MPFFSVVIPVYNKEPHVARAVRSVLNQTFSDFELILIDDASTDNSLEEMEKFNDPRIRILHREEPGPGGYAARNLGIREARAEWIAFLDSDDEWFPEHLEKMRILIDSFPRIQFFSCGWEYKDGQNSIIDNFSGKFAHIKSCHIISCKDYLCLCLEDLRPICMNTVVLSKGLSFCGSLFPEDRRAKRGGDLHAWLRIICWTKEMGWSPHIGAIYYRDSVNMVTKTAVAFPDLMSKTDYRSLSEFLNPEEKIFLKRYFNRILVQGWKDNLETRNKNFFLPSKFYWKEDKLFALFFSAIYFIPPAFLKKLLKTRRYWVGK